MSADNSINSMVKFFDLLALRVHPTFCRIGPTKRKRQILRVLRREGLAKRVQRSELRFEWTATARLRRELKAVSKERSKWAASPQSKRERKLCHVLEFWQEFWQPPWLAVVDDSIPSHPFSLENDWHVFKILIRVIYAYQWRHSIRWLCSDLRLHRNSSQLPADAVAFTRETLMTTVLDICVADMRTTIGRALWHLDDDEEARDEQEEEGDKNGRRLPQLPSDSTAITTGQVQPSE